MPPLPVVPNVLKVIISSVRSDSDVENILHIAYTGDPPGAGAIQDFLEDAFVPFTVSLFNSQGSTDLTGVSIEGIDLSSDTGASFVAPFVSTGVRTGDFAPSSACVVTSWTIPRRYRGGHPRTYWPFGTAGTYETGSSKLWDSGFITAVEAELLSWSGGWSDTTEGSTVFTTLCNVSYVSKVANPTPPYRRTTPVVDVITGSTTKQRICSQRRRLGKILG